MGAVRGTEISVIEETHRPIPLRHAFYSPKFGIMNIKSIGHKYVRSARERKRFLRRKPSSRRIVQYVLSKGQIPIMYFCFNRRACEYNAEEHSRLSLLNEEEVLQVRKMVDELVELYNLAGL